MGSKEFSHDRRQDGSADFQTSKFQSVSIIIFSEHELIFLQSFQVIGYTSVVSLTTFESALGFSMIFIDYHGVSCDFIRDFD